MEKPTVTEKRAILVEEGIRITWLSLVSHLPACYGETDVQKENCGDHAFHKKCVREYSDLIQILAQLY